MSHHTLDFGILSQLQRELLDGIRHLPRDGSVPDKVSNAIDATDRLSSKIRSSPLEETVGTLLRAHPHVFSSAVTSWRSSLQTYALRMLEKEGQACDGIVASEPHTQTLNHPRTLPLDAQTLQEALPFLRFDEHEQAEGGRGVVRKSDRAIRTIFSAAVERMQTILAEPRQHHPERARLLSEMETLLDRARAAGCDGKQTTLEGCIRTFSEDDILYARAVDLLDRLRGSPADPMFERSTMRITCAAQAAEQEALPFAARADLALAKMGAHSGERAISVLLALRLGVS